jgi:predicted GTPase
MKDLPPTLTELLKKALSEQNTTQNRSKHDLGYPERLGHADLSRSAYDFVVDLTRPADIYGKLQAYHVSFPLGKKHYDSKVIKEKNKQNRFMVNVVGRYNVGKTYVLRLLANIDLGHSFTERTNGISVSLPTPKDSNDPNIALIDTAGTRTPVDYSRPSFQMGSYERQISDAFIQEIALNSSEIFLLVINQLTLDDQLYLKALYKRLEVSSTSCMSLHLKM